MHYKLLSRGYKRVIIIILWLTVAIASGIYLTYAKNPFKIENSNDPKAESSQTEKIMQNEFPFAGSKIFLLYQNDLLTANNFVFKSQVKLSLHNAMKLSFENRTISPYENDKQISKNKKSAYAVIETNSKAHDLANHLDDLKKLMQPKNALTMTVGGEPSYTADVNKLSEDNLRTGEFIALPICLIALIFIFNGILPALLTIIVGVINITIIVTILYLLAYQIDLTIFVLNIATMLGLGLSLDYTLLITYRFKEEYAKYMKSSISIQATLNTAGKSVFFSGMIFLVSIASLIFFPINVLYSIGIGGIVVILVTLLSSTTLLPAVLSFFEKYVTHNNTKFKTIIAEDVHNHRWYKFTLFVMKYPLTFMLPTILILVVLGYPFFICQYQYFRCENSANLD